MTISDTARNRAKQIISAYNLCPGVDSRDPDYDLLRRELETDLQGDINREVANALAAQHLRTMQAMKEGA